MKVYLASTSLTTKSLMEFSGRADCILSLVSTRCTLTVGATTHSRTLELMALSRVWGARGKVQGPWLRVEGRGLRVEGRVEGR